ncbi:MAG: DNA mismatch repair endonuclease MutL [Emergencia sp.]|nr:DNA mismatch repair endonuclease MutL [Emergencia sp.]
MIKVLEKNIADKIAAGEVIERPVSIIKELVENSIDAGADSIVVEIKNGGKTYIRVTDNGCGIAREEVETAFLRHATSKISTVGDLDAIETLGFRGEALASIAAVTHTEFITKTKNAKMGVKLLIHGSEVIANSGTGCPDGTTIIVTDLFYNTPARRKFLKSDGAESGQIIDFMSQIALAYPAVKFRFINNGNIVFSTTGKGDVLAAILAVYKISEFWDLVPVSYEKDGNQVSGYISRPSLSRTNRKNQIFFVNGRVVSSKVIEKGVAAGYRERLFDGRYPVAFLFLKTDPASLDVNIHPNKKEVRFDREEDITGLVAEGIIQALGTKSAVTEVKNIFKAAPAKTEPRPVETQVSIAKPKAEEVPAYKTEPKLELELELESQSETKRKISPEAEVDIKQILSTRRESLRVAEEQVPYETPPAASEPMVEIPKEVSETPQKPTISIALPAMEPFDFQSLTLTGAIFGTYITAVEGNYFYLIDQHAAHERVFYEKLVGEYLEGEKLRQPILTPILLEVPLAVKENEYDWLDCLSDMGFTIEEFGQNSYVIKEIPTFMTISEAEDFAKEFIDSVSDGTKMLNTVVINKLITKSCKAAVKANDKLSMEEMKALITQLSACKNPFSCPHGRPTFIRLSKYEVEKMFKRV